MTVRKESGCFQSVMKKKQGLADLSIDQYCKSQVYVKFT